MPCPPPRIDGDSEELDDLTIGYTILALLLGTVVLGVALGCSIGFLLDLTGDKEIRYSNQVILSGGRTVRLQDELRKQFLSNLERGAYRNSGFTPDTIPLLIDTQLLWINFYVCPKCPETSTFFETRAGESFFSYPVYTPYTYKYGKFTVVLGVWTGNRTGISLRLDPVIYVERGGARYRVPLSKDPVMIFEEGEWRELGPNHSDFRPDVIAQVKKYYEN